MSLVKMDIFFMITNDELQFSHFFCFQILRDTRSRDVLDDQANIILGKAGKDFEFGDVPNRVSLIKHQLPEIEQVKLRAKLKQIGDLISVFQNGQAFLEQSKRASLSICVFKDRFNQGRPFAYRKICRLK
jgi:hypothetical protein